MRLISAALAVALTPVFVALPTVSFAAPDQARPVAPKVSSVAIGGVDRGALAKAPTAAPAAVWPEVFTAERSAARFTVAGVSWSRSSTVQAHDVSIRVRVKEASGWSAWEHLGIPDEGPDSSSGEAAAARVGTAPLVTPGATAIQVRVDTATGATPADLKVTTIDPGTSPADDDLTRSAPAASASAAAVQPTIITRAQWGADESLRGSTTLSSTVKAITIHHTAGSNSYTQDTAAAQIRGIYAYDTTTLGWADIAYNFLVDKWGRIYEGRAGSITKAVRGAHAMGFNTDTMGVAALGNYETASAPAAMVDGLAKVAGWKLSQYGVNPAGKATLTSQGGTGTKFAAGVTATLDAINPHQSTSYTLCPGQYLTPQLGTLRTKAANYAKYSTLSGPPPVTTSGLYAAYGSLTLKAGSTGPAVRDLQVELNRRGFNVGAADGIFGQMTTTGVTAFQKSARLAATGVVAANDWKALSGLDYTTVTPPPVTPPPPVTTVPGFDADGRGDVMGRTAAGDLYYYPTAPSSIGRPVRIGPGWNAFNLVLSPGDWTGDGRSDVLARKPTGELYLYRGNGKGGFTGAGTAVGRGWQVFDAVVGPGDWNGDRKPDLLARKPSGELYLYAGNGAGGFASGGRQVASGWQTLSEIITPGDFTGDGRADLLGRKRTGELYVYPGTGTGSYQPGRLIGRGWQVFNTVFSTGDLTGDRRADLVARTPAGRNVFYPGNGTGGFASAAKPLTVTWGATTRILGVR
jgi:peptidoglycan hydrolase-like protein with peptidoglycan-binding domain